MEVKLRPEYRMIEELRGRVGNWVYRTKKGKDGKPRIFAQYRPKPGRESDTEYGKMF